MVAGPRQSHGLYPAAISRVALIGSFSTLHSANKLAHLIHCIAGIRWRAWYKRLESRRDWVLTPLSTPGQNLPCPPTTTIRFCHSRCQVSARGRLRLLSTEAGSVPTAVCCCWLAPTSKLA